MDEDILLSKLNQFNGENILITVLNWGLGHATRSIPIIEGLLINNNLTIASDGGSLELLKTYFPGMDTVVLPSYDISYKYDSMLTNAIHLAPKVLRTIRLEKKQIHSLVKRKNIGIVISDNRFGCFDDSCHNIFITHQLNIYHPNSLIRFFLNFQNRKWIRHFDEVWVPDYPDHRLAGMLSTHQLPLPVEYLGRLSIHMKKDLPKEKDILVLLSGPEPQRTYLQESLLDCFGELDQYSILFIGGKKGENPKVPTHIEYIDIHLSEGLTQALNSSKIIVCRSGYSTLMDIYGLDIIPVLIPTPGQTEQEYLADFLTQKSAAFVIAQSEIKTHLLPCIISILDNTKI